MWIVTWTVIIMNLCGPAPITNPTCDEFARCAAEPTDFAEPICHRTIVSQTNHEQQFMAEGEARAFIERGQPGGDQVRQVNLRNFQIAEVAVAGPPSPEKE